LKKLVIITIIIFAFLISGCNYYQVESLRKTHEIKIDGNDEDWIDAKYFVKEHDVVFGVMNDNEFLYICFYPTTNELTRQILSQGMTLWINNNGKRKKEYGIRFPLGMQNFMNQQMPEEKGNQSRNSDRKKRETDSKMMDRMVKSLNKDLEIIGPGKDQSEIIKFLDLKGIEIGFAFEKELFAYELKIPLSQNSNNSIYIDADPTSKIALGFEVPKPDTDAMKEKMKEIGNRPSDGERSVGGRGMEKGGMQGDSTNKILKSKQGLDIWATIQLVEN
jgi:hypothetical protein